MPSNLPIPPKGQRRGMHVLRFKDGHESFVRWSMGEMDILYWNGIR